MAIEFLNHTISINKIDRIAKIELGQTKVLNELDKGMIKELIHMLKEVSLSDDIDIVVLTGDEGAFSAGVNCNVLCETKNENDFYHVMDLINELVATLYSLPKVTISVINGNASGLGLSLVLATDHIIVNQTSKIEVNAIEMGLIPIGGTHFFLERRLGEDRTKHLIWENRTLSAEEAVAWNVVNEIAKMDLEQTAEQKIQHWLSRPVQAMIKTKKLLAEKNRPSLLKMLELEKFAQYKLRQTEDFHACCQAVQE